MYSIITKKNKIKHYFFNESKIAEPEIEGDNCPPTPPKLQPPHCMLFNFHLLLFVSYIILKFSFFFWLEVCYGLSFIEKIYIFYDIHVV